MSGPVSQSNTVYYTTYPQAIGWNLYHLAGDPISQYKQISVGVVPGGTSPEVYGIGIDNNIYDASKPSAPLVPNNQFIWLAAAPQSTSSGAEVFGLGDDNRIYYTTNNGSGWTAFKVYGNPNAHYNQISAGLLPSGTGTDVYGMGYDNNIYDASNPSAPLIPGSAFIWIAPSPQSTGSGSELFGLGLNNKIYASIYYSSAHAVPLITGSLTAPVLPVINSVHTLDADKPRLSIRAFGSIPESFDARDQSLAVGTPTASGYRGLTKEIAGASLPLSEAKRLPDFLLQAMGFVRKQA